MKVVWYVSMKPYTHEEMNATAHLIKATAGKDQLLFLERKRMKVVGNVSMKPYTQHTLTHTSTTNTKHTEN